jgi:hypothetical protein
VVEVFGDQGSITVGDLEVARPGVIRGLLLLDLQGAGAVRAGSVAALSKLADRRPSQGWARHFYERSDLFGSIDRLIYSNAHNDESAVVLFERAANSLACPTASVRRLDNASLRVILEDIAQRHNLVFL